MAKEKSVLWHKAPWTTFVRNQQSARCSRCVCSWLCLGKGHHVELSFMWEPEAPIYWFICARCVATVGLNGWLFVADVQ